MTKRKEGINALYLVLIYKENIAGAIKFVDDYRPKLNIDRRYANIETCSGCIWWSDKQDFTSKEEGNAFYQQKKSEGWTQGTEKQYEEFVDRMGNMTY